MAKLSEQDKSATACQAASLTAVSTAARLTLEQLLYTIQSKSCYFDLFLLYDTTAVTVSGIVSDHSNSLMDA